MSMGRYLSLAALLALLGATGCEFPLAPKQERQHKEIDGTSGAVVSPSQRQSLRYADFDRAVALIDVHDYERALMIYDSLARYPEERADALVGKGACYNLLGRNKDALNAYEEALAIDPDLINALFGCAAVHYRLGGNERSIAYYRSVLRLDSTQHDAYWGLAAVYDQQGMEDSAVANAERFIAFRPDSRYVPALQEMIARCSRSNGH